MGRKGPAPTPTPILKARGSKLATYERGGEVAYEAGAPACPGWLCEEARAEWRRQVKQLEAAGVVQKVDGAALAAWCEAWGEFRRLCVAIEDRLSRPLDQGREADVADTRVGYAVVIAEGLLNAKNRAVERLLKLAGQFGFTPAARARIKGGEASGGGEGDKGKARFFAS